MIFETLMRSDNKPVRILLVDDSAFARRNLAKIVLSFGCKVAGEAADGTAAVRLYEELMPDVVLMDVTMPQMRGLAVVQTILQRHPKACIVMVSSVSSEEIMAVLKVGARHFVPKPVTPEVLYDVLRYVLRQELAVSSSGS